jgi:hypothetical protein
MYCSWYQKVGENIRVYEKIRKITYRNGRKKIPENGKSSLKKIKQKNYGGKNQCIRSERSALQQSTE